MRRCKARGAPLALVLLGAGIAGALVAGTPLGRDQAEPPRASTPAASPPPATGAGEPAPSAPSLSPSAGFVDSHTCRPCHLALYEGFQSVGMARSFSRPDPARDIEDFAAGPFRHEASGEVYEMAREGRQLFFRRWREEEDAAGGVVRRHELEIPVDWVLGSGHHSRTYLYRTAAGELYQLPLAWYSAERAWGMAPGFDRADHLGVARRVLRECLFCHNAFADLSAGGDVVGAPARFPPELPQGIGCQRCHGPGARHVAIATDTAAPVEAIRASIVNPGKLSPARRDDVCNQCHFQPAVALAGVRRFGRGDFSYRPGEPLEDYLVQVDVEQQSEGAGPASGIDRFEINHAAYRLRQSRCYMGAAGNLSCLSCHDPHRRLSRPETIARVRSVCLSCHAQQRCRVPPGERELAESIDGVPGGDCASCHMPRRRPEDVVHVAMIDHRIGLHPARAKGLAPRAEREPILLDAWLLEPDTVGAEADLYRTLAVARTGASADALRHLASRLAARGDAPYEALLELCRGLLERGENEAAARFLARRGTVPSAAVPAFVELEAILAARFGERGVARGILRALRAAGVASPEALANLARLELEAGDARAAVVAAGEAAAARPHLVPAWLALAAAAQAEGDRTAAERALRSAIVWEPRDARGHVELARLLAARPSAPGEAEGAGRSAAREVLERALNDVGDPQPVRAALAGLER